MKMRCQAIRFYLALALPGLWAGRRLAAWCALLSLLIQVAVAPVLPRDSSLADIASFDLSQICAAHLAPPSDNPNQQENPTNPDQGAIVHCLFCLPLTHLNLLPTAPLIVLGETLVRPAVPASFADLHLTISPRIWGASSPQAPPVS